MSQYEKVKIFLIGMIAALALVYLFQANIVNADSENSSEIGRYQIMDSQGKPTIFIIDTETGVVKEFYVNLQTAKYENIHTFKTF
ncbi:hypothetical protein ISS30_09360 [bacterium]|nr:hypothetical protein [bacterium]